MTRLLRNRCFLQLIVTKSNLILRPTSYETYRTCDKSTKKGPSRMNTERTL